MERIVRIVTDSGCDLPPSVVEQFDMMVVPLIVRFGTDVSHDGQLSMRQFWERAAGPNRPQTSQPSVGAYEQVFEGLVGEGDQLLCLTITGKHSGAFNAARLAAQRFGESVVVFDSLSVSLGLGVQALAAAQAVVDGCTMAEILALLRDMRSRMRVMIVLDTLEYLRRGGRAHAFVAAADRMARVLNIKVIINVVEGELRLFGAARSFRRGLDRVLSLVEEMGPMEHLAVVHALNPEGAEEMADRLAARTRFDREGVRVAETGPVLATHAGPGVVGVLAVPTRSIG